jgi:ribonuclease R
MDLDRALIASRHVGERHSATIVGIQRFGIFATIGEPFVDGMVPVHTIQDDYYVADEIGSVMRGKHTGREFRLAHRIEVEIAGVNIARRQVELRLAETAATVATRRPAPRARKENRAPRDGRRQRAR